MNRKLICPVRTHVADQILQTLLVQSMAHSLTHEQIYFLLTEAPQRKMADLAFSTFLLAKELKLAPPVVSQKLQAVIAADDVIDKVVSSGPYLNFVLKPSAIRRHHFALFRQAPSVLFDHVPKTMIEFSQPNTHKELHVGHMRNACLGDSLVKLYRFAGIPVISSTFPGDVGTHVAKCLWYLKYHNTEPMPSVKKGEWLGQIYSKANLKLEDEEKTDKYENNKKQLTEILQQLEKKSGSYYDQWKETREWSIELMQEVYKWINVSFDQWYWESDVDQASVEYVKELYKQGKLTQSQGAVGMDLEADNLGFCLLLKSDGNGLYATKDLELARRKFQDYQIEKNIYVVDQRQALHFKQVFKVLERLGFSQSKDCYHLQYNFVELPDGAMSSRKGNIIPLMQLVKNMEDMIYENYLKKFEASQGGDWTAEDVNLIRYQVATGAIKYGMLKMDTAKKIVFNMQEWLKLDGDSGPFIQYAHARIQSLLKKQGYSELSQKYSGGSAAGWSKMTTDAENDLLKSAVEFYPIVQSCVENNKPSLLCTYLFQMAQRFNFFYHECPIGTVEDPELKLARLELCQMISDLLDQGLGLLGIPAPKKM